MYRGFSLFFFLFFLGVFISARGVSRDLSGNKWKLWLDTEAEYLNDTLLLPPVTVTALSGNAPTCGWSSLYSEKGIPVSLPATVEQYYWGRNGNKNGIAGDYRGVS